MKKIFVILCIFITGCVSTPSLDEKNEISYITPQSLTQDEQFYLNCFNEHPVYAYDISYYEWSIRSLCFRIYEYDEKQWNVLYTKNIHLDNHEMLMVLSGDLTQLKIGLRRQENTSIYVEDIIDNSDMMSMKFDALERQTKIEVNQEIPMIACLVFNDDDYERDEADLGDFKNNDLVIDHENSRYYIMTMTLSDRYQ